MRAGPLVAAIGRFEPVADSGGVGGVSQCREQQVQRVDFSPVGAEAWAGQEREEEERDAQRLSQEPVPATA